MRLADELRMALSNLGPPDRRAVFVGVLNKHMGRGRAAVLVGGGAVEFYCRGAFTMADVDLVANAEEVSKLLVEAGFEAQGRYFTNQELAMVVDLVGAFLRPGETVHGVEVQGYRAPMVSAEDCIIDRLLAAKHFQSEVDWAQAILLWAATRGHTDVKTLRRKASANDVTVLLDELVRMAGSTDTSGRGKKSRSARDDP